jgi:hypothetical protein
MDVVGHAVWTDTTQYNRLVRPNKDVKINRYIVDGIGYTEPDPMGVLSPDNSRLSGPTKWVCFRVDSLARHLLQLAYDFRICAVNRAHQMELVQDIPFFRDQREETYHDRDLKPKLLNEIRERLNSTCMC